MLTVLPQELAEGNVVKQGDFSTFWLRTTNDGLDTPEEVSADNIINVLPRFTPGKEFKHVLNMIDHVEHPPSCVGIIIISTTVVPAG